MLIKQKQEFKSSDVNQVKVLKADELEQIVAGAMPPITISGYVGHSSRSGWGFGFEGSISG